MVHGPCVVRCGSPNQFQQMQFRLLSHPQGIFQHSLWQTTAPSNWVCNKPPRWLTEAACIHPVFHVLQIKPVCTEPFRPPCPLQVSSWSGWRSLCLDSSPIFPGPLPEDWHQGLQDLWSGSKDFSPALYTIPLISPLNSSHTWAFRLLL